MNVERERIFLKKQEHENTYRLAITVLLTPIRIQRRRHRYRRRILVGFRQLYVQAQMGLRSSSRR